MATPVSFGGKTIYLPGAYATTQSAQATTPVTALTGVVCIVDTGRAGEGRYGSTPVHFNGGSGALGTGAQGKDAIYVFDTLQDFRSWMRGGNAWDWSGWLFRHSLSNPSGIQRLYYIVAAESTPAEIRYVFGGSSYGGGVVSVKTRSECTGANGIEDVDGVLRVGFSARIRTGVVDPSKFIMEFWRGTFKTYNVNGDPFDYVAEANSTPQLIVQSAEFLTVTELKNWMAVDGTFQQWFYDGGTTATGSGVVTLADVTANSGNRLATGGSQTYSPSALSMALESLVDEQEPNFFLCDRWGDEAQDMQNVQIVVHATSEATFKKQVYIGGGSDSSRLSGSSGSIGTAQFYNSQAVSVIHSGVKIPVNGVLRDYPSVYHASGLLGYLGSVPPWTNPTEKQLGFAGVTHQLTYPEQVRAQQSGVCFQRNFPGRGLRINQGNNTLQFNTGGLITPDGTSWSTSVVRIVFLVEKLAVMNAYAQGLVGGNLSSVSNAILKAATQAFLQGITSTPQSPNLIQEFRNVTVSIQDDARFVTFETMPNGPVDRIFMTNRIYLPNSSSS